MMTDLPEGFPTLTPDPTVSVIITTHHGRKAFCKRAIKSVLGQTYHDFEIIVVDDASRDATSKMVKKFDDSRIVYHRRNKSEKSQAFPKNDGIRLARGKYIAFLDSDNTYRPDHLNVLVRELEKSPDVAMVYGDRWIVDAAGKDAGGVGRHSDFNINLLMSGFNTGGGNYIDTSDVLVRKEALYDVGGWDERYKRMLDWNLWVRMVKFGHSFKRVPLVITNYTLHHDSISNEQQDLIDPLTPPWDPIDVEIQLPHLGEIEEPKVAIFSITYDRLEYTEKCFKSMRETAGYEFDHFIVDNGSTDGTQQALENMGDAGLTKALILNSENRGISIASNQALDLINDKGHYDIILKVDNDCLFLTDGWLKAMVNIWKRNRRLALSPYIQGLRDNPGGAPRMFYGNLGGELLGMTQHLGGICHFVDARAYKNFRWNENQPLHGVQDLEFSQVLARTGYQMGYLENYYAEHIDGTDGQLERYPEYFERRKEEKTKRPERTYIEKQEAESANSDGTIWGERVRETIDKYLEHIEGPVLDVGANDGTAVQHMIDKGFDAQGIDISKQKVTAAQKKSIPVIEGRMEQLPYSDKQFGTVFCSHTLEHAEDIHAAAREIQRVARRALIVVPIEEKTQNPGHTSPITSPEYLKDVFEGYKVLHEESLSRLEEEYVVIFEFDQ